MRTAYCNPPHLPIIQPIYVIHRPRRPMVREVPPCAGSGSRRARRPRSVAARVATLGPKVMPFDPAARRSRRRSARGGSRVVEQIPAAGGVVQIGIAAPISSPNCDVHPGASFVAAHETGVVVDGSAMATSVRRPHSRGRSCRPRTAWAQGVSNGTKCRHDPSWPRARSRRRRTCHFRADHLMLSRMRG